MPLRTQQLEMEKRTKKKKRKRKRSGRKGRVHRGVPTFPQHNAASFLHMPAGGCRLNRQGCTLRVCPRGFRPYLYSSSSLQSLSTRFGEKNNIEVVSRTSTCKTGFPPNLLPGGDTRYCLSCVVWRCRCLIIYLYIAQGCSTITAIKSSSSWRSAGRTASERSNRLCRCGAVAALGMRCRGTWYLHYLYICFVPNVSI